MSSARSWESLLSGPHVQHAVWWTAAATGCTAAAAVCFYAGFRSYEHFVPYEYHYRPGSLTGVIARWLKAHSSHRKYMDGCFDMMHYGHANALRQARACGDQLVVGLIPDSEIIRCKGPPVQCEEERMTMVSSVKWVDEVITGVPYDLHPDFIHELFTKHRIDYIVHGDDPCLLPDGTDAYEYPKKLGRFRAVKRTEGVSSTDIVGRMLLCRNREAPKTKKHRDNRRDLERKFSVSGELGAASQDVMSPGPSGSMSDLGEGASPSPINSSAARSWASRFLPTSRRILQFSDGNVAPRDARIVYIDGAFDVFHVGHVKALEMARAQGDFLLVGIHTDEVVRERRGQVHLPIMDLHERTLSVLACKSVNEVVIGAPPVLTADVIKNFNISLVVKGRTSESSAAGADDSARFAVAEAAGIFRRLDTPSAMTTSDIISRILANRNAYEARNAKKVQSEVKYEANKEYVEEL
eukprot:CAMPEP_0177794922 /NCGR_PEP_ID=MMETSP0491_2-20121128/25925_1 /TAXON_ID=63592 /ORGANISM="Tetraselmis chuii, Strain PLY429" /LENGTH=466 /DNA_ID=CAMNT_0019317653 /DNA_START=115 /DNA_END=1515 /DNA_ORIENTATION=+